MSPEVDSPATPAVVPAKVARRAAKAAKPPKAPRAKRTVPARTLRVRIAEIGPHHLEAFDLVAAKDEKFAEAVRSALDAHDTLAKATLDAMEKESAAHKASEGLTALANAAERSEAVLKRLDAKASLVAKLHDDVPEAADIDAGPTT